MFWDNQLCESDIHKLMSRFGNTEIQAPLHISHYQLFAIWYADSQTTSICSYSVNNVLTLYFYGNFMVDEKCCLQKLGSVYFFSLCFATFRLSPSFVRIQPNQSHCHCTAFIWCVTLLYKCLCSSDLRARSCSFPEKQTNQQHMYVSPLMCARVCARACA